MSNKFYCYYLFLDLERQFPLERKRQIPPHCIAANTTPELNNDNATNYHFCYFSQSMSITIDHFMQLIYMLFSNWLMFWYQAVYANNELRYEYGLKYMAWDDNGRRKSFFKHNNIYFQINQSSQKLSRTQLKWVNQR